MPNQCDDCQHSTADRVPWNTWRALALFAAGCLLAMPARGEQVRPCTSAQRLVTEALQAELHGDSTQRQRLLSEALDKAPQEKAARWQNGYVQSENKWVKFDDLAATTTADKLHNAYLVERQKYGDTAREQLQLADWCSQRGLADQERAHLTNSLDLDPNQPALRVRLGEVQVDGAWVSKREAEDAARQARTTYCGLKKWTPITSGLALRLKSRDPLARAKAARELLAIHDPAAISSLEVMAAKQSPEIGVRAVEAIARQHSPRASLALARVSTFASWYPVGQAAAEQLQSRPYEGFVPVLLAAMETPVQVEGGFYGAPCGRLVYRQEFLQEKESHHELQVLETIFQFKDHHVDSHSQAKLQAEVGGAARAAQAADQNRVVENRNDRIARVLRTATGQQGGADPQSWWKWWYDYNETVFSTKKPTAKALAVNWSSIICSEYREVRPRHSCLAAGTPVWTDVGTRPIEQIKIGDLVLAQDPETGELAYKPVLRTTVREGASMARFRAGDETFRTSGGHLFWLSGTGWEKARDLKPGQRLHALGGSLPIESNDMEGTETVYNLVVADFHTYFIGQTKLLSHDIMPREATMARLPGLVDAE